MKSDFFSDRDNQTRVILFVLTVLTLVVYWQTVGASFINLDDNLYVYGNPYIANGLSKDSIRWAFTEFHSANWHPLTWISHMVDIQLFGLNPSGHHATNILFHLANSILVFFAFREMTGAAWKSAIVAALFAVHPAHVESVAWISERKDVLSTFFWMLGMLAYCFYARNSANDELPAQRFWKNYRYWLVITFLVCGLMAKPMVVTLPFVFLLLDYWPLDRFRSLKDLPWLIVEKIPMITLAGISSVITVFAQRSGAAVITIDAIPIGTRILNSVQSYFAYISLFVLPKDLSLYYPYDHEFSAIRVLISVVALITVTVICFWHRSSRKYLLAGWLWFGGTLIPVIGLVQVGNQAMADRYTYVPFIGLFVMVVWGLSDLVSRFEWHRKIWIVAGIWILVLTILAFNQASLWRDQERLYKHTLSVNSQNALIAQNLAHHLMVENRMDEALSYVDQALKTEPNYVNAINTRGIILLKLGRYNEAITDFRRSTELDPTFVLGWLNLSVSLAMNGNPEEAEPTLERAVTLSEGKVDPVVFADSLNTLATAFAAKGKLPKAIENYQRGAFVAPTRPDLRASLARAYFESQNYDSAREQAEAALTLNRNDPAVVHLYGRILLELGRKAEAISVFEEALRMKPDFVEAKKSLSDAKGER